MAFERMTLHVPPEVKLWFDKTVQRRRAKGDRKASMTAVALELFEAATHANGEHVTITLHPRLAALLTTQLEARQAQGERVTMAALVEELLEQACQQAELAREEGRR